MMQFLIAFDQLLNTIIGGMADETLSARSWRLQNESKYWNITRKIVDTIFFFQKDHCYQSYISEKERKQLPNIYKK